jgi:hypothetical protein
MPGNPDTLPQDPPPRFPLARKHVELVREASELVRRADGLPEGSAERVAAAVVSRLLDELAEVRRDRTELRTREREAAMAPPLLRFAPSRGETVGLARKLATAQRLGRSGEIVPVWVNAADLQAMQDAGKAENQGDHRVELAIREDDEGLGHVVDYDDAHNDPPAELRGDALAWLAATFPDARVGHDACGFGLVVDFRCPEDRDAFLARWARPMDRLGDPAP